MFGRNKIAIMSSELLGTALLTLTALMLLHSTIITYFIASTLAVAYALMVLLLGPASGGHFNPAVTLGLWSARRLGALMTVMHILMQFLGALAAWGLFTFLANRSIDTLKAEFDVRIFAAELIGTALLVMGVTAALARGYDAVSRFLTITSALFIGAMIAHIASRGLLNPAVALGVRSWGPAYVFGPLVGGIFGANLYNLMFPEPVTKITTKVSLASEAPRTRAAEAAKPARKTKRRKK